MHFPLFLLTSPPSSDIKFKHLSRRLVTQSKSKTKITIGMCLISLIVFTDKYQGHVWTLWMNEWMNRLFSLKHEYLYMSPIHHLILGPNTQLLSTELKTSPAIHKQKWSLEIWTDNYFANGAIKKITNNIPCFMLVLLVPPVKKRMHLSAKFNSQGTHHRQKSKQQKCDTKKSIYFVLLLQMTLGGVGLR